MSLVEVLDDARGVLDDAIQLRRRIHRHPEIGLTLPRTQAAVLEAVEGLGLEVPGIAMHVAVALRFFERR